MPPSIASLAAAVALTSPANAVVERLSTLPELHSAVAVGRHGQVLLERGFGPQSRSSTVYDVGSVAKSFTAAAVLQLVERRRLRLDERVSDFFPGAVANYGSVTVAQLLTHTAGLPAYFASDQEVVDDSTAVRRILATPAHARGRFLYSDAGYTLLAAIVQRAAHMPFERYVRTKIFLPAGLHHTGFIGDPSVRGRTRAEGYVRGGDRGPAGSQAPLSWSIMGAGGILASAGDLLLWADALLAHRIVDRTTLDTMWSGHVAIPHSGSAEAGYGWVIGRDPQGRRVVAVGGGTDFGYTADVRLLPHARVVVVLSSTDRYPARSLARTVLRALGW